MEDRVILVDENDREIGTEEKLETHRRGLLHRAFSLFVFDPNGRLLLQKRAAGKYHSGGLWANTCCSHPLPGETIEDAVHRKLKSEMGFDCEIRALFQFIYKVQFQSGLYEHELDHVFAGRFDGRPVPNPQEAQDWKWIAMRDLRDDLTQNPGSYVHWLKLCVDHPAFETHK
jgi:isopentenyl-diphosphate delta-isomerase